MFIFNNGTSPVFDAYIGTLSRGVLNLGVVICIRRSGSFKLKSGALLTFASNNYWPEEGAPAALADLDCRSAWMRTINPQAGVCGFFMFIF